MADEKALFRAEKKRTDRHRKADGKTCVTCPASRHAQMLAEHVGTRKPYPMLQEEPEHCAGSILSAVGSLYEARLLLAQNRSLTTLECDALREAADYLEGDGVSMPAMRADMIAITLRSIAGTHGATSSVLAALEAADHGLTPHARAAFERAMKQAWGMVNPLIPPGQPGSYARGEHNGICAALQTVRENFARELAAGGVAPAQAPGLTDEQIDAIAAAQDDEGWFTGRLTKLEWRAFARDVLKATSGMEGSRNAD